MKILSIETSCDDTCITIFEAKGGVQDAKFKILSNVSNSQIKTHIPYGGVYPMLAKREHAKNLPLLFEQAIKKSGVQRPDLIVVTYGPGLEPSLWTGIDFAKKLAEEWEVPLFPVNHMEGHVLSVFGKDRGKFSIPNLQFPILSLLVSGGHTELVLTKKWMNYKIIGETLDDAVGEAFDKVARMMGLPYPGGPEISRFASTVTSSNFKLPRPMLHTKDFNFSFSGLKTAVLYLIKKLGTLTEKQKAEIAFEFQNAAIECLVSKTAKAVEKYKVKTLIIAGGVAANRHLRSEMKKLAGRKIKLFFPEPGLSTDNSVMIGIAGYLNYIKKKGKAPEPKNIKATGNLRL